MATLIHSPQTPPIPSTSVEDTRDYQTLAQVQTQIITSQNGAGHRVLGGTANDVLIVTAGGGISSTQAPSLTGPLQLGDGTAAAPAYSFSGQSNTGIYRVSTSQIGFSLAGSLRMMLSAGTGVLNFANSFTIGWAAGGAADGSTDTTIARVSAKVIQIGNGDGTGSVQAQMFSNQASSTLSIASNTIAPTNGVHHCGAGLIKTITVPTGFLGGGVDIIPDAAFTYDATGNVVVPAGGGTATVNKTMRFTWDGTKWNPSY